MKFRGARRALNVVLTSAAVLVLVLVLIDVYGIGPRQTGSGSAMQTLMPAAFRAPITAPIVDGRVTPTAAPRPIRVCPKSKVMLFGDSLTAGYEGYRGPLFEALQIRQVSVDFVGSVQTPAANAGAVGDPDHESHPKFLIGPNDQRDAAGRPLNLADNVAEWFSAAKPDVVLLLVGAEELRNPLTQAAAPDALTVLVGLIRDGNPNTLMILSELPPSTAHPATDPALVAFNAKAKQLADADLRDLIFYAPVSKKLKELRFDPAKDLFPDGVRFTLAGGRKYAIAIEPIIAGGVTRDRNRRCAAIKPGPTTKPATTTTIPSTLPSDLFGDDDLVTIDETDFIVQG
jgi:lysophospholipase L1-like esterase